MPSLHFFGELNAVSSKKSKSKKSFSDPCPESIFRRFSYLSPPPSLTFSLQHAEGGGVGAKKEDSKEV